MLLSEFITLKFVLKWLALDLAFLHLCTCCYLSSWLAPCCASVFTDKSNNLAQYKGSKTSIVRSRRVVLISVENYGAGFLQQGKNSFWPLWGSCLLEFVMTYRSVFTALLLPFTSPDLIKMCWLHSGVVEVNEACCHCVVVHSPMPNRTTQTWNLLVHAVPEFAPFFGVWHWKGWRAGEFVVQILAVFHMNRARCTNVLHLPLK